MYVLQTSHINIAHRIYIKIGPKLGYFPSKNNAHIAKKGHIECSRGRRKILAVSSICI